MIDIPTVYMKYMISKKIIIIMVSKFTKGFFRNFKKCNISLYIFLECGRIYISIQLGSYAVIFIDFVL